MPIDYSSADDVLQISFGALNRSTAPLSFPNRGILSNYIANWLDPTVAGPRAVRPSEGRCFASASVEMWHRAVHSFLCSIALSSTSPLWSRIAAYYSSHFVMRAFSHALGFFKSFRLRRNAQIVLGNGTLYCRPLTGRILGEHAFYWRVTHDYPPFKDNPLFPTNNEREETSDCAHRNFANYIDHIDAFERLRCLEDDRITNEIDKISRIRRFAVRLPAREDYPDVSGVQILAYQRIVSFQEFLDERVSSNRFWKNHRHPVWSKPFISFHIETRAIEEPEV
jgi:hypothetical protein